MVQLVAKRIKYKQNRLYIKNRTSISQFYLEGKRGGGGECNLGMDNDALVPNCSQKKYTEKNLFMSIMKVMAAMHLQF